MYDLRLSRYVMFMVFNKIIRHIACNELFSWLQLCSLQKVIVIHVKSVIQMKYFYDNEYRNDHRFFFRRI